MGTFESRAAWRVIDGSLCFADISGFTALAERLALRGASGGEELVETLSRVFAAMIDIAHDHGGMLLKFGGDALLLFFDGDDHARRAAGAAVRCVARCAKRPSCRPRSGRCGCRCRWASTAATCTSFWSDRRTGN